MSNPPITLNYEERKALDCIRKALKRNPEIAKLLMADMSKGIANTVLLQVQKELTSMLAVSQAFSAAAAALVTLDKDSSC